MIDLAKYGGEAEVIDAEIVEDDLGQPPPHDLDAEAAVLSSVMLQPGAIKLVPFLEPEHFYSDAHREMFKAAKEIEALNGPIDIVLVASRLKEHGRLAQVGGFAYLTEVLAAAPSTVNVLSYATEVHERWRVREVIKLATRTAAIATLQRYSSASDFVDATSQSFADISRRKIGRRRETNLQALTRIVRGLHDLANGKTTEAETKGIPTGFSAIDELTGGLHAGHKVTIAGMPGRGKTTIGLQIARHVAELGIGVLFFAAEQRHDELLYKLMSAALSVPFAEVKAGKLSPKGWSDLANDSTLLAKLPLWFDCTTGMTVDDVHAEAVRQAQERVPGEPPLGLIVVDHLHHLKAPKARERFERMHNVAEDSRVLKRLAFELNVPLIELAQQKPLKGAERPGDNCIQWSSVPGELADVQIYLHREREKDPREVTAIVQKVRFGATGEVKLYMHGECSRFTAWDDRPTY